MRTVLAAVPLLLVALPATAEVSNDRLCRAIGDTPNVAVPPRDRAFFQDHCACLIGECAYKGGTRHRQLVAAVKCKTYVNGAAEKELGHEIGATDAVGGIEDFRVVVEGFCLRDRSGSKVLATVRPAITEQKRRDVALAESKKREEEEVAAKQAAYWEEVQREQAARGQKAREEAAAEAEKARLAELSVFKPPRAPANEWAQFARNEYFNGLLKSFSARYEGKRTWEQLRWQAGSIQWHVEDRFTLDELTALARDKARAAVVMDEVSVGCKKQRPEGLGPDLAP